MVGLNISREQCNLFTPYQGLAEKENPSFMPLPFFLLGKDPQVPIG
jgi:hypothetical protein